jgi:hypothetical protein
MEHIKYLILPTYSAAVNKYLLKQAIRYKTADYHDLALTAIQDRHDFETLLSTYLVQNVLGEMLLKQMKRNSRLARLISAEVRTVRKESGVVRETLL